MSYSSNKEEAIKQSKKSYARWYHNLHNWVKRNLGKASLYSCSNCQSKPTNPKALHWANKSHLYKKDLADWMVLCSKCHGRYDYAVFQNVKWRASF